MSIDHNRIKVADLEKNLPNKILTTNTSGELEFSEMYNGLDCTVEGKALDATQGKKLKDLIDNISELLKSDNLNLDTIQELVDAIEIVQNSLNTILVNDLSTGGVTKALTAEMGKLLQDTKVDKVAGERLINAAEISKLGNQSGVNTGDQILPTTLPASDVYAWAKEPSKPTYSNTEVGLGNVDNTSDVNKPISTATQTALNSKEDKSNKNIANGYAGLGSDGKLLSSQLPSIAISNTFVVATQAAMLALTVETGDVAVRTDLNKSFILKGADPTLLGDWQELLTPTDSVSTVFGRNGSVSAQTGDYTADQITETTTRKFQTANQQAFNDATSSIQTQLNNKEAFFTKNTAFNRNFGTTAGTVTEGNDTRVNNGQTAFSWGNHAGIYAPISGSANYIQNQNSSAQSGNMWINGFVRANNAQISSWSSGSNFARFGHENFNGATNYGFLQQNTGSLHLSGTSIAFSGAATFASTVTASNGTLLGGTLTSGYIPKATGDNILGNSIIKETSGYIEAFTGLTGVTFNPVNQSFGSISFSNGSGGTTAPVISGKSNNNTALTFASLTNNTNAATDMNFNVRENDGTDFSTLTSSAFSFSRFATTLIDILRNGNTTFTGSVTSPTFIGNLNGNATTVTDGFYHKVQNIDVNSFSLGTGIYRGSTQNWTNKPSYTHNGNALLNIETHPGNYFSQLWFDTGGNEIRMRRADAGVWNGWSTLLHSSNFNSYAPSLTGSNASGTWGISISGNAATATNATNIAWSGVNSRPNTLFGYGITDSQYKTIYSFGNGCLVELDFTDAATTTMIHYEIRGNGYLSLKPILIIGSLYKNGLNASQYSVNKISGDVEGLTVFNDNGKFYLWFKQLGVSQTFAVKAWTSLGSNPLNKENRVVAITDTIKPVTLTNEVTPTVIVTANMSNVVPYNGTTPLTGTFNGGSTTPTNTTRLNYEGYFYPTALNLIGSGVTVGTASHYLTEVSSNGFVLRKTLANVKAEIVTTASVDAAKPNITTGTGVNNTMPIWTGTNTQGNSILSQSGNGLYYPNTTGDKISLFENRLGLTSMYGLGMEASSMYYKSNGLHHWYTSSNADGGTSAKMTLSGTTGLSLVNNVTATSFIKTGGTSSQFLKADGTVDINAYLPLTGGTLSGGLKVGTIGLSVPVSTGIAGETGIYATSSNKVLYLYNNGTSIKLDAYDYGTSTPLDFNLGGNGGNIGVGLVTPSSTLHLKQDSFNLFRMTRGNLADFGFELGGANDIYIKNYGNSTTPISILSTGATTFTSSVTAPTFVGNLRGPNSIYSSVVGSGYDAAVQIREVNLSGAQGNNMIYAPRLAFHWAAVVASSLAIEPSGRIAVMNNPGSSYEAFVASNISASVAFYGPGTGLTGTANSLSIGGNSGSTTNWGNRLANFDSSAGDLNVLIGRGSDDVTRNVTSSLAKSWLGLNNGSILNNISNSIEQLMYNDGSTFLSKYDSQSAYTTKSYTIYNTSDAPLGSVGLYNVFIQKWASTYGSMIAIDTEPGKNHLYLRSKYNDTWSSWNTVLDSSNYNSYSPSLTGAGASGTWGINVTGSSRVINIGTNGSITDLNIVLSDTGSVRFDSFGSTAINKPVAGNNANGVITFTMNHGSQYGKQISFADNDDLYIRKLTAGTYGTWRKVWHDGNYSPANYLLLSGGTITGDIVVGTSDRDNGMFGTYDATKTQHIWSMGTAYRNSSTGVDFGNLYGLAYKHTNNTTGGTMAGGHQMVWCDNGIGRSALGLNIWTSGQFIGAGTGLTGTAASLSIGGNAATSTNAANLNGTGTAKVAAANLNGYGFWNNTPMTFGILMSTAADTTYGGRIAGETSSDYNMYFTMQQGTNRGFVFRNSYGTPLFSINGNGVRAIGDIIAYSSSDSRLKDNVKKISNPLEKLKRIGGYEFDWNSNQDAHTGHDIGVIAQEIETILPEIVTTRDNGFKAVKYEKLTALLIEVNKEQQKQIENQQKQIDELFKLIKNLQ